MENILVRIITPISILLECKATIITMPGDSGEFGVLPLHAPLIASLKAGVVKISTTDQNFKYFIYEGAARVNETSVDILTEFAIDLAGLNKIDITEKIAAIKASTNYSDIPSQQDSTEKAINRYQTLLQYL
jgi:F-type H+-transporting ATPase subunit epsilon